MKRLVPLAVLFTALAAVPLLAFNDNKHLVDEVIRMWRTGSPVETIISFVVETPGRFDVTFDDVIAMRDAGVPPRVVRIMLEEAEKRGAYAGSTRRPRPDMDPTPPWTAFYDPWWFLPRYFSNLPHTR